MLFRPELRWGTTFSITEVCKFLKTKLWGFLLKNYNSDYGIVNNYAAAQGGYNYVDPSVYAIRATKESQQMRAPAELEDVEAADFS